MDLEVLYLGLMLVAIGEEKNVRWGRSWESGLHYSVRGSAGHVTNPKTLKVYGEKNNESEHMS